jgi:large subunit ribosomal protein L29
MSTPTGTLAQREAAELRSTSDEELLTRLREAKEELFNLRFQVATGQLDNNARLRTVRRNIARIYTVMRERELGIEYVSVGADVDEPVSASSEDTK